MAGIEIKTWMLKSIMHEYSVETEIEDMYYRIIYDEKTKLNDISIYTTQPGRLIGKGGEIINRYTALLKEKGIDNVNIIEILPCRISSVKYGLEQCPVLTGGSPCYDYDRLGTLSCGMCGSNPEMAKKGRVAFAKGIKQNTERMNNYGKVGVFNLFDQIHG